MASARVAISRGAPRARALATGYRTRVLVAILLVVSVALILVLVSLPRLLEGYFVDQERRNLEARANTLAMLLSTELSQRTSEGSTVPILMPRTLLPGDTTLTTLGTAEEGFVRELAHDVALADVTVTIAPEAGAAPVYELRVPLPEDVAEPGQGREAISASASRAVRDRWWTTSPEAAPARVLTVTLSDPFTFREQTTTTITQVLLTAALIALIVALVTALLLAQWLARPLRRLTQTSRLLAEGRLDARVRLPTNAAPEVQELASAFNDMAERLQESVTVISDDRDRGRAFLADVSHELRTPIAALRTFNELLLEGAGDDPTTRDEFLRQTRQQVERLDWLAANLLELSKLDSGLVSLDLREDDLRAVAESAVEHAEPLAERKGVALRLHAPDEPIVQAHDPPRLGQVLANLVGNAVKFTPSGGHVDVTVAATDQGARLTVSDDGVGIDPDELEHVFDRFFRGTRRPEERASGSGLGLAIVRSIVDMHGGRVAITSTPDVGTTVTVDLPRDVSLSSPVDAPGSTMAAVP